MTSRLKIRRKKLALNNDQFILLKKRPVTSCSLAIFGTTSIRPPAWHLVREWRTKLQMIWLGLVGLCLLMTEGMSCLIIDIGDELSDYITVTCQGGQLPGDELWGGPLTYSIKSIEWRPVDGDELSGNELSVTSCQGARWRSVQSMFRRPTNWVKSMPRHFRRDQHFFAKDDLQRSVFLITGGFKRLDSFALIVRVEMRLHQKSI